MTSNAYLDAISPFIAQIQSLLGDASLIAGSVAGLPTVSTTADYGRYAFGSRFGFQTGVTTAQDALLAATARFDLVRRICDGVITLATSSDRTNLGLSLDILTGSIADAASDPADAVRILASLASYTAPASSGTIGTQIAARCRQAALASLCDASQTYYLTSSTEALALLYLITDLIDSELVYCGDNFLDQTYAALGRIRAAVTTDILARGANLAPLRTVTLNAILPAAVIAQRLYRDGTREDEIIERVDMPNPLFTPSTITVLAR